MIVGAGAGNAYVIGSSDGDYILLGYRRASTQRFNAFFYEPSTDYGLDEGRALAMAGPGNVRATGKSLAANAKFDFATVARLEAATINEPDNDTVHLGDYLTGSLGNLLGDGDTYRVYQRTGEDVDGPELQVEYGLQSPISAGNDPSEICVYYEGKCSVSTVKLTIEIYNVVTTSWEVLDVRKQSTADTRVTLVMKNDPDCYIGSNPEIKLRLTWDDQASSVYDLTASVDQLVVGMIGT